LWSRVALLWLAAGVDKDAKALDGYTAHDTASDKGHRGVMRALVRA
jgi:hypothetical protein